MDVNKQLYTCPMHPEIRQEQPGMCSECGMRLVPVKLVKTPKADAETHNKHAGHSTDMFLKRFWVSLILTIPVVLYSDIVFTLFKLRVPEFPGSRWIPALFGSIVFFYGGVVFLQSAWREIQARMPGMMTLIALAITTAYSYSAWVIVSGEGEALFWELTTLITIMLLGHWIEMRAVSGAQGALKELSKLLPDTAEIVQGAETKTISLSEIKVGDIAIVRPGGRIPVDGVVTEGTSEVNESVITGESVPVKKQLQMQVIAGTINGDGALRIQVTQIGEHTFLAGIMRLVAEAQASKSQLQILADRAAFYLTVVAIATGGLTFIAWILSKASFGFALERVVAVLVVACPHALGLAVPLVASISTTLAARNGFLIRQRIALEIARKVDIVLFDKTGTLTKGEYGITDIWTVQNVSEAQLLQYAASVDARSEHFISKAIVQEAKAKNVQLQSVQDFKRLPGKGVSGTISGSTIAVGGLALIEGIQIPQELQSPIQSENEKGKTIIYVVKDNQVLGAFALADVIREESRQAIQELKRMKIRVAMITGDSDQVASWVAKDLGIDEYFAKVLPQDKAQKVKILQEKGYKVAMTGDGINDAPALTQADLGIAIGAGTNVAIESAGIILVKNDPRDIPKIIKLSQRTYAKMIQNLFWAAGYNVIAIPLAAGVLAYKGIFLQPAFAAALMSLSTVIVAVNAVLLKNIKFNTQ